MTDVGEKKYSDSDEHLCRCTHTPYTLRQIAEYHEMATPRKTRSHGPAEDIDLEHPAGGAEADAHLIGVHPPTRLEKEVSNPAYIQAYEGIQANI